VTTKAKKPDGRAKTPPGHICGHCSTAAATATPISEHDKCSVRFGHACVCAEDNHQPTRRVIERVASSLHTTPEHVKEIWYG